jgi:hypothetical protein
MDRVMMPLRTLGLGDVKKVLGLGVLEPRHLVFVRTWPQLDELSASAL